MVDPNPARGMPLALQRYWLVGKGAAKIRWNVPGDFMRCVRHLSKYFPKDPRGLCNILHTKATGGPPGHGSLEHHHAILDPERYELAMTAAMSLLAAQGTLGDVWAGPIAPIGVPTGEPRDTRILEHGALKHRPLPIPLAYTRSSVAGHAGAVTVGRVLGYTCGPDHNGQDYAWAWGDWLNADVVPEVTEARYLVDQGVVGPSIDPGGKVAATVNPDSGTSHVTDYTIGRVTLVPIAAFSNLRIMNLPDGEWPDGDPDMMPPEGMDERPEEPTAQEEPEPAGQPMKMAMPMAQADCGCRGPMTYAVNAAGWRGLPLAPRQAVFDNDVAVQNIARWAGLGGQSPDVAKLNRAFMWRDQRKQPGDITAYRLPVGDIVNGQLMVNFHAIYAAAALLSGAHGGLPDVPDQDKAQIRGIITNIYQEMAKAFNDGNIRAPWDRSQEPGTQMGIEVDVTDEFAGTSPQMPYGDVTYADPGYQSDKKKRYPIDTEAHVRAAWAYINQADNAGQYNPKQLAIVKRRIMMAAKKLGIQIAEKMPMTASAGIAPLEPPAAWFRNPGFAQKTRLTVTAAGQVYGHMAAWNECHRDVSQRECVLAPHSKLEYAAFHLGEVLTAEGEVVRVGKIVQDTRHAAIDLGYAAASLHYDNTGDEVAVVRAGEDEFGIWVAGAVVPEATPGEVAKLRRSPLSGDWRAINGHLELTAALAVNVPAFPVYAMENDERLALVAAGTIMLDDIVVEAPPTGIVTEADDQYLRALEFADLLEDEEIYAQRERAAAFAALDAQQPVPDQAGLAPAPDQSIGQGDGSVSATMDDAQLAMQMSAVYSIVEESPTMQAQAQTAPAVPAAPVPVPVAAG